MDHLNLNIDRLRLLSEESSGRVSRNSNIERWLTNVEEYSKDWKGEREEKLPRIETGQKKDGMTNMKHKVIRKLPQNTSETKLDSGVESDSVFTSISNVSRQKRSMSLTDASVNLQQNLRKHSTSRRNSRNIPTPINERSQTRLYHPLSVRTYRKMCKKMGILPLRRVMGQFGRTRFILNQLCLSTRDIRAICKGLLFEDTANYLDFSGNTMDAVECNYVLEVLAKNHVFNELRLADNQLSGEGITRVTRYFMEYKIISVLDISGNKLTDRDGHAVATIIKVSPQLRVLHAHHNEFREQGAQAIGQVIGSSSCKLEELDLSWNHIRLHGAVAVARGIEKNKSLEYINLGWNGFAYEGCVALSDALRRNTCLERLDISCNRIHPPALMELMKGLLHNKVLKVLIMDKNPLTPSFTSVFLEGIQGAHKSMALQELSLQGVVVDRDFQGILDSIQHERPFHVEYETSLPVSCRPRDELLHEVQMRNHYNMEPLRMLYLLKERNRAQDFFHKINKDHDDGLEPEELSALFKQSGIPVSQFVIDRIMEFMDTDGDGKIDLGYFLNDDLGEWIRDAITKDYRPKENIATSILNRSKRERNDLSSLKCLVLEFLVGDKKMKKISRDQARSTADEPTSRRYSRTFRKAHIQQLTSRLQVEDAYQYLSPIASASNSPGSSRRSSVNF